jgi:hypothetical protein
MKYAMLSIAVLLMLSGCRKNKDKAPEKEKTPLELLTQKKWIFNSFGFDDNKNKKIDTEEEMIRDCEKDNSFEFFTDLTAVAKDNQNTCGAGNPVNNFTWKFTDGASKILIEGNAASIVTLNEDSLVLLYHIEYIIDGFMATYKH